MTHFNPGDFVRYGVWGQFKVVGYTGDGCYQLAAMEQRSFPYTGGAQQVGDVLVIHKAELEPYSPLKEHAEKLAAAASRLSEKRRRACYAQPRSVEQRLDDIEARLEEGNRIEELEEERDYAYGQTESALKMVHEERADRQKAERKVKELEDRDYAVRQMALVVTDEASARIFRMRVARP